MKRGKRRTIAAPGSPHYTHTLGAYNWRDGRASYQTKDRKNSDSFIEFIEHLMFTEYLNVKVIMVMDNTSYHHRKASMAALSLFEDRLYVVWLPKYCPYLNAIERFWLQLKTLAAANRLHHDIDELIRAIDETICNQNQPDHPDRLDFAQHFLVNSLAGEEATTGKPVANGSSLLLRRCGALGWWSWKSNTPTTF